MRQLHTFGTSCEGDGDDDGGGWLLVVWAILRQVGLGVWMTVKAVGGRPLSSSTWWQAAARCGVLRQG